MFSRSLSSLLLLTLSSAPAWAQGPTEPARPDPAAPPPVVGTQGPDAPSSPSPQGPAAPHDTTAPASPGTPASPAAPTSPAAPSTPTAPHAATAPSAPAAPAAPATGSDEGELPATPPPVEEHAAAEPPGDHPKPSLERFHEALDPHGRWVETPEYGLVWIPNDVPPEWRPYANGHWVNTDQGWTFVAAEPWGWAPFHYGRWVYYAGRGAWVWIPGYEWAPAWVTWRYGGGVVGWAPLGPVGVSMAYYGAPSLWLVVGTPYFFRPLAWRYFYPTTRVSVVMRTTYFAGVPRRGVYLSPPRPYFARLERREAVRRETEVRGRAVQRPAERPAPHPRGHRGGHSERR